MRKLKAMYPKLASIAILVMGMLVMPLEVANSATYQESAQTIVVIGNPPSECPKGWPTTGQISQGPEGATSHADAVYGGYEAFDIATPVGTPVYATIQGTVVEDYTEDGNPLDQRIGIRPACPGLGVVHFWHLSSRSVKLDDNVAYGQVIGRSGHWYPHLHYQFNNTGERNIKLSPPYVPQAPTNRACNGIGDCNLTISNAP